MSAGQNKRRMDPLTEMVETERAFSRTAGEKGIPEAFTEFIAEDGILFRPGPVPGKKWFQEHPSPTSSTRPLLVWEPMLAGVSRAGDLGYTTGPWQLKNDLKDAKFAAFGTFMTVWKKQPDGSWRFAVDLGIRHSEPKAQLKFASVRPTPARFSSSGPAKAQSDLLDAERAFSQTSAARGAVEALLLYSASDVRVLRNQHEPFIGRKVAVQAMPPLTKAWTWTPSGSDVSASGDLGYSYGLYELRDNASGIVSEEGNYLHVWRKVNGTWKLIIDVADPHPPEKKS